MNDGFTLLVHKEDDAFFEKYWKLNFENLILKGFDKVLKMNFKGFLIESFSTHA